jgi:hypothetical protein
MEEDISRPKGWLGSAAPTIANLQRLNLGISVRLLYDRQHKGPGV